MPSDTVPRGVPAAAAALQPLLNVGAKGDPCPWPRPSVPVSLAFGQSSPSPRYHRAQPHPSPVLQERPGGPHQVTKVLAMSAEGWRGPRQGCHLLPCPEPMMVAPTVSFTPSCQGDVAGCLQLHQPSSRDAAVLPQDKGIQHPHWCPQGHHPHPLATDSGGLTCPYGSHCPHCLPSRGPSPSCSWDAACPRAVPPGLHRSAPLRRDGACHPPGQCWDTDPAPREAGEGNQPQSSPSPHVQDGKGPHAP